VPPTSGGRLRPRLPWSRKRILDLLGAERDAAWAEASRCDGCGGRFPRRELVEAMEDDLGVFEGERFCRPCARRCGVL